VRRELVLENATSEFLNVLEFQYQNIVGTLNHTAIYRYSLDVFITSAGAVSVCICLCACLSRPSVIYLSVCLSVKALNHLLNIPDDGSENSEALNLAVDVVGAASDVKLTTHLMNYLLGDVDGTPKVCSFITALP